MLIHYSVVEVGKFYVFFNMNINVLTLVVLIGYLQSASMSKDASHVKESKSLPWEVDDRIPNTMDALHYDLYLHPNLKDKTFEGNVRIKINTSDSRDYFVVHSKNLTIKTSSLYVKRIDKLNKSNVNITEAFTYLPHEFFVIKTESVEPGIYELYLEFNGSLAGKIVGFYYSEYLKASKNYKPLATTKFEPTFARQAFPCFDEPKFRSTYTLTLVRPSEDGYIGLSNMPIESEEKESPSTGLTKVHFKKSVPMVTYLVCFIVSDFIYKERELEAKNGNLSFRVYAPAEKIEDLEYALDFGSKTLLYYEEMFGYKFPLPKCDMAAIPDYSSGATEHWGIVTFRETNIVYNENTSSTQNLERVSSVIAHEMAHQWFGNLVTMKWWNDLWLNEGFARYIEYKGVDKQHPDWDMKSQFVVDVLQSVFEFDAKLSSHPIVKIVNTPEEINAMFDTISYEKGSSVLRMLESFMTEEYFQKGVNSFLSKYAFKNAVTQDLYDQLTEAWKDSVPKGQKSNISDIMNTWTMQMGYPVVNVTSTSPSTISVTQSRFLQNPEAQSDPSTSPYGYKWDIPISVITSAVSEPKLHWLYRENSTSDIEFGQNVTWFKVNHLQKGYYRVNYSPDLWEQLEKLCANKSLKPEDRSSLYDDCFALADANLVSYDTALNLTRSLEAENHYVPWKSAASKFAQMQYLMLSSDVLESFKTYVRSLVSPIYKALEWGDNGTHLNRTLRNVIVDLASLSGLNESLKEAGYLLQSWIDDVNYSLPLDTKRKIYWWGMIKSGSNETWNVMWQRCLKEQNAAQKSNLYYGLANSQDNKTLERYINLTYDVNNTRMQDFLNILQYIASNPVGMDLVWDWVRSNWSSLVERYGQDDRYLGQLIPSITHYFSTDEKYQEAEKFYNETANFGIALQYKNNTLETIKGNIYWVKNYVPKIEKWLNSRN